MKKYPIYTLVSGKWIKGGEYSDKDHRIPLYEKDKRGTFVQYGIGVYKNMNA